MDLRACSTRRAGSTAVLLVLLLVALTVVAGCSAAQAPAPGASAADPGVSPAVLVHEKGESVTAPRVALQGRVTRVAGRLSDVRREQVARRASATVRAYLDGAFAGAEKGPFSRFQAGLRRAAHADEEVLANPARATVTRARAWFAVAAPAGRAVGVTARLRVDLDADGAPASLTGRLLLTRADGRWQVFGYDLARSHARTGGGGR